SHC
ncbi:recombination protein bet from phage origin, partial [Escherichia coli 0.1288]